MSIQCGIKISNFEAASGQLNSVAVVLLTLLPLPFYLLPDYRVVDPDN